MRWNLCSCIEWFVDLCFLNEFAESQSMESMHLASFPGNHDLTDIGLGTGSGNYRTNLADGGPRHRLGSPVYLGQTVDGEFNAQPQVSALGDDNDGSVVDEDGVVVSNLVPGLTATFSVSATNQTAVEAVLRAEVDLNQNGSFLDPGERQIKVVPPDSSELGVQFDFEIPPGLAVGERIASRFRISTDAMLANQVAPATLRDGEVEDHSFVLSAGLDWGDLPDRCPGARAGDFNRGGVLPDYRTLAIDNGPSHVITPNLAIIDDRGSDNDNVDPEIDGQPDAPATGDDLDGNHDDLTLLTALTRLEFVPSALGVDHSAVELSIVISQAVKNTTGSNATFYAFMDTNRDGDFEDPGEKVTTIIPGDGSVDSVNSEFDAVVPWPGVQDLEESFALRCRISSDPGLGANGPAPDGEVQDDILNFPLSIGNPRPTLVTPDIEGGELIQLTGPEITVPLGVPFSPQSSQVRPEGIQNAQNLLWSLLLNGEIAAGGALNLDAGVVSSLGVGSHPVTHSFEDIANGNLYVIRFFLRIVDLPGYSDWASASDLPASLNRPAQDADEDGVSNLVEFALGGRPDLAEGSPKTLVSVHGGDYLTMSYA